MAQKKRLHGVRALTLAALVLCAETAAYGSDISESLSQTQTFYQKKYTDLQSRVSKLFGIDFPALEKTYQNRLREWEIKASIIEKTEDPEEKRGKLEKLSEEFSSSEVYRYLEAVHFFRNEMEKDHRFVGELLQSLENILEKMLRGDAFLREAFSSGLSKNGLIMTRVVWASGLYNVSAETEPILLHSLFANKSKTPLLIKLTPQTFSSELFLRSILVHELSHVWLYRSPEFSDSRKFEGGAVQAPSGNFSHYFKSMDAARPSYQYHLLHEYYSFKAQILYDEMRCGKALLKAEPENRRRAENMMRWCYSQLNPSNQAFVRRHPAPPLWEFIGTFKKKPVQ